MGGGEVCNLPLPHIVCSGPHKLLHCQDGYADRCLVSGNGVEVKNVTDATDEDGILTSDAGHGGAAIEEVQGPQEWEQGCNLSLTAMLPRADNADVDEDVDGAETIMGGIGGHMGTV
jgi:hypothetical protein